MRVLSRPALCRLQRQPLGECSLFLRTQCKVSTQIHAQTVHAADTGVTTSRSHSSQEPLVWRQSHIPPGAGPGEVIAGDVNVLPSQPDTSPDAQANARAMQLMRRIKAARCWQQLKSIVDENARALNHLHVSAIVTHMAQLHTSSSGRGSGADSSLEAALDQPAASSRASGRAERESASGNVSPTRTRTASSTGRRAAAAAEETPRPLLHKTVSADTNKHRVLQPLRRPLVGRGSAAPHAGHVLQTAESVAGDSVDQPGPSDRELFLQRMERAVLAHLRDYQGRQLANTLWAVAKLGHRPPTAWLEALLTRVHAKLPDLEPQHLANTLYALMLLRYMPPPFWLADFFAQVVRRVRGFRPGELAHLCLAGGKLQLRPGRDVLGSVAKHAEVNMGEYGVRELSLLLYGVAQMGGFVDPRWLWRYRVQVLTRIIESGVLPRQTLESLALRFGSDGPLARCVAQQLHADGQLCHEGPEPELLQGEGHPLPDHRAHSSVRGPQQHQQSRVGHYEVQHRHGTAAWRLPPQTLMLGQPVAAVHLDVRDGPPMQRENAEPRAYAVPCPGPTSQEAVALSSYLPTIFLSMSGLQYQPPPLFISVVLTVFEGCIDRLGAVQLTSMLQGLALLRYRPKDRWFMPYWRHVMDRMDMLDCGQRAMVLWSLAELGLSVPSADMNRILLLTAASMPDHTDAQLVSLLQAATGLQPTPQSEWLDLLDTQLYDRLPQLPPAKLVEVFTYMAALGRRPHRIWIARWVQTVRPGLPELGLQHLTDVAFAAAELRFRPPTHFCAALLAAVEERMQMAVEDFGAAPGGQPWQHAGLEQQYECRARLRAQGPAAVWYPVALSRLLWGLAMLDVRPDGRWMATYMSCLRLAVDHLPSRELSQVVWALARLRHDPGPAWMAAFKRRAAAAEAAAAEAGRPGTAGEVEGGMSEADEAVAALPALAAAAAGRAGRGGAPAEAKVFEGVNTIALGSVVAAGADAPGSAIGHGTSSPAADHDEGLRTTRGGSGSSSIVHGVDYSSIILQGMIAWAASLLGEDSVVAARWQPVSLKSLGVKAT